MNSVNGEQRGAARTAVVAFDADPDAIPLPTAFTLFSNAFIIAFIITPS